LGCVKGFPIHAESISLMRSAEVFDLTPPVLGFVFDASSFFFSVVEEGKVFSLLGVGVTVPVEVVEDVGDAEGHEFELAF